MSECFEFSKELYSKESLIKAAYDFIDDYYVHLDSTSEKYIVYLDSKTNDNHLSEKEFINAILIHETRKIVFEKTNRIREMLYARAMASTLIDEGYEDSSEKMYSTDSYSADEILTDWFDDRG
ncbi:His-Xaa-Ser system protein HxsD [Lachnospiraceae bacterium]|nr:His-Xaa-Ser system protein HxsD [Lachnospiraceae bacterium]